MRFIIFIRNKANPSDFYRIYQYIDKIKDTFTIKVVSSFPSFYHKNLAKYSNNKLLSSSLKFLAYPLIQLKLIVYLIALILKPQSILFIQREIFPRKVGSIRKALLKKIFTNNKIVWDFDDNIIELKEISKFEFKLLEKHSSAILVCHKFLRNLISDEFHYKVELLPTTDLTCCDFDLEKHTGHRIQSYNTRINLVWVGTFNNLPFLEKIIPALETSSEILKNQHQKEVELKIISNGKLETKCKFLNIKNIKWTRNGVIEELIKSHVGLLPLDENDLTRGKCAFKAVQYIGFGIPVIASNVGFNSEVIKDNYNGYLINETKDWSDNIISLSTDINLWQNFSAAARVKWQDDFNSDIITAKLKNAMGM